MKMKEIKPKDEQDYAEAASRNDKLKGDVGQVEKLPRLIKKVLSRHFVTRGV